MDSPSPPDPMQTAQAQAGLNTQTANTQARLNNVNQVTPYGNLTYTQTGTKKAPSYTATTSLTPEQQGIFNTNQQTQANIAGIGRDQSARVGGILGQPVDFSNDAVEGRLFELGSKRLDPMFAQQGEKLEQDLINRGIRPGSDAYNTMHTQFDQGRNDAYTQLMLNGRGQSVQEILAQRNQPINEITALMSGSQVSQPNFQQTPQTGVANTDYAGNVASNYAAQTAQNGAMMGGLFGLAGTLGGAAMGGGFGGARPPVYGTMGRY